MNSATVLGAAQWFLRVALAAGFLSAVADRFGLWGPAGTPNVAWGAWQPFIDYVAKLNWFAPPASIPILAWTSTVAEVILAIGLLIGWQLRWFCTCCWHSIIVFCHHDDIGARAESTTGLLGIRRCGRCISAGGEFWQGLTRRWSQPRAAVLPS